MSCPAPCLNLAWPAVPRRPSHTRSRTGASGDARVSQRPQISAPRVCRGSLPIAFPLSCSKKADGAPQAAALRKFRLHTKNVQNPWKMFQEFSIVSPWCAWAAGQFFFTTRNKARRGLLGESKAHAPGTALASRGRTRRSRRSLHTHPDPGHGDLSPVSGRLTETRVRTVRATPGRGGQRESPRGARRRGGDAGAEPGQPASVPSRPSTRGPAGAGPRVPVPGTPCWGSVAVRPPPPPHPRAQAKLPRWRLPPGGLTERMSPPVPSDILFCPTGALLTVVRSLPSTSPLPACPTRAHGAQMSLP